MPADFEIVRRGVLYSGIFDLTFSIVLSFCRKPTQPPAMNICGNVNGQALFSFRMVQRPDKVV